MHFKGRSMPKKRINTNIGLIEELCVKRNTVGGTIINMEST